MLTVYAFNWAPPTKTEINKLTNLRAALRNRHSALADIITDFADHEDLRIRTANTYLNIGYTLAEMSGFGWKNVPQRRWKDAWPYWQKDPLTQLTPAQRQNLYRRLPTFPNPAYQAVRMAEILEQLIFHNDVTTMAFLSQLEPELQQSRLNGKGPTLQECLDEYAQITSLLEKSRPGFNHKNYWVQRQVLALTDQIEAALAKPA